MRSQSRSGFTLIELMVAMTLTLVIMAILSQAFVLALETFAGLKGIGDMQQNLRTAAVAIHSDLGGDHVEGDRKLNDPTVLGAATKIQAGFFAVRQGSPSLLEGLDQNNLPSYRAVDHFLYFTVKRKGNRQEDFFTAGLIDNNPAPNSLNTFFAVSFGIAAAPGGATEAGNNVTIITTAVHNFLPGQTVTIAGVGVAGYNGRFIVASVPSTTSFTYVNPTAGLAPSGSTTSTATATPAGATAYGISQATLINETLTTARAANRAYYGSQWAEVLYYLENTGSSEEPNVPGSLLGTPTFALKRAQFVMVPDSTNVNGQIPNAYFNTFANLSCNVTGAPVNALTFYSPTDVALAQRTFPTGVFTAADPRLVGVTTTILPNVISFQVQVMPSAGNAFIDVPGNGYYDTTQFNSGPGYTNNFGLRAIQITLRVWDFKTRQTRQTTIMQDL